MQGEKMTDKNRIIKDLKEIKYYFAHKDFFEKSYSITGENKVLKIIDKYNEAICNSDQRLHEIYILMYIQGLQWEVIASSKPCSMDYLARHHKKLIDFLQKNIDYKGE